METMRIEGASGEKRKLDLANAAGGASKEGKEEKEQKEVSQYLTLSKRLVQMVA